MSFQKHKYDKKKAKKLVFLKNSHQHRTIIFILEIILQEMKIRRWPKDSLTSKNFFHIYSLEEIFRSNRYFPTIHFCPRENVGGGGSTLGEPDSSFKIKLKLSKNMRQE